MNRKERILKNLKRITALLIFAVPCAIYLILIRRGAGDALLYTAPYQWHIIALSFAAGLFSYIILRRERPTEDNAADDFENGEEEKAPERAPVPDVPEIDPAEYPELFSEKEESETNASYDMSAGISAAISMQKAPTVTVSDSSDADRAWEEFSGGIAKEEFTYDKELYENIPDLPEDYEIRYSDEEEKEYSLNYTVRNPRIGESIISKFLCVIIAAAISVGTAYAASTVYCTESDSGFFSGGKEYLFEDVRSFTVSQKLLGSLSVEVVTEDGKKTELFPATLFKGEKFSEEYDSIYAYMAHVVRTMRNSASVQSIEDAEDIITSFKDMDDKNAKYIEEIIGEKLK